MTRLQERIQETFLELNKIQSVKKHYEETVVQVNNSYAELKRLSNILEKEHADIEQLEALSVKGLFHKVLGSKEQQLEKERQEYLQASLKYNEHKKSIEVLEYEKELLEKKLKSDETLTKQLKALKKDREHEILTSDTQLSKQLLSISEQADRLFIHKQEVSEAHGQGRKCLEILDLIIHELQKAKQWGQWDMYGGGRRRTGYFKHDAVDRARNLSYQAKHKLIRFKKELADIGIEAYHMDVNVENFGSFTDIFFDNLISDWIIQKKIHNSLINIQRVKDKIINLSHALKQEDDKVTLKLQELAAERDRIILK